MKLTLFKEVDFLNAVKALFKELKVPVNYVADEPTTAKEVLKDTYKDNSTFALVNDVYFVGMVDDAAFKGNESLSASQIKSDYDGVLIFGITLNKRENNLLPTRSQLAEISRAFNREFYYTPVVLVFKYHNNDSDYLAFANTERLKYKQEWREGEKAGKVSLLRDIDINNIHRGHKDIINQLKIPTSGTKQVDSFAKLYSYWQEVFSVSILNKKFYNDLSNWYFWAIKHVTFPNKPTMVKVLELTGKTDEKKLEELINEHNAQNVIRLLTRLLFTWFIKEKKLIPKELFDLNSLQKDILNEISPYHEEGTMFAEANKESIFYKAILQNLFFASLNCPIKADGTDNRTRGFRGLESYGKHRGIDWMMRYKKYFKNPDAFLKMMNDTVPFLNGGLFECLDDKTLNLYIDGFSDQMTKGEFLVVPDFLFFGVEENIDLSKEYGVKNRGAKQAAVKGLINILKSYKFTITENTPIEEDVALDPELLGKVFENLLASYNPETKTTARKQTGSFYTPREIVNYMVDESLIAYLKNAIKETDEDEQKLDKDLHELMSFDPGNPYSDKPETTKQIIRALDNAKILDPAVGSGAFPMGVLQKMVHLLQKLDPNNELWKKVQLEKAMAETEEAYGIEDKQEREQKLIEINNAFDQRVNDPDFARKLYLIENCIYGVDIQPIATQISKLRFFISLVVDQKVNPDVDNFGIRPLPNLETKFVTANTLIGIQKENSLFYIDEVKQLETELKQIRHKLFNARTKDTKLKYRQKDEVLRNKIANILKNQGLPLDDAEKLATWDPYDQNASSPFFDPEWMFDIKNGFDVVIGNPPYIKEYTDRSAFDGVRNSECYQGKMDLWYLFGCKSIDLLKKNGNTTFIATNNWVTNEGASKFRNKVLQNTVIKQFLDFKDFMIFESASIQTMVYLLEKEIKEKYYIDFRRISKEKSSQEDAEKLLFKEGSHEYYSLEFIPNNLIDKRISFVKSDNDVVLDLIFSKRNFELDKTKEVATGIDVHQDFLNKKGEEKLNGTIPKGSGIFNLTDFEKGNLNLQQNELELIKPFYNSNELFRYYGNQENKLWVIYTGSEFNTPDSMNKYPNLKNHLDKFKDVITSDNKPYGLHRARKEDFFQGEKIISQRKCPNKPIFTFTDFDCYVSQTYFVIKSNRINQKYLTALLNSSLIAFWLKHKGKMQGAAYQVDKGPILEIPIYKPSDKIQSLLSTIVDAIIHAKTIESEYAVMLETIINALIFNLYFPDHMKERGIDVLEFVERDINKVMQGREFEPLGETEKENTIEQLHQTWSDPNNEVVKRMGMFKEKSPDILKPILES